MDDVDLIYVNTRGSSWTNKWVYYRVRATAGLGVPAGELGSALQVCRVKWPSFEDIEPVVDTPGTVGFTSAEEHRRKVLQQWGVDHDQSTLIGMLPA